MLKHYSIEIFIWLAVFVMLTISNISVDLFLSMELSVILTVGMMIVFYTCRFLSIPYLYKNSRFFVFFLLSILFIGGVSWLTSYLEDSLTSSYLSSLVDERERSLLDIQLPAETKPFFEEQEYNETSGENSRLYISSLWKTVILYFGSFLLSLITYYRKRTSEVEEQQALLMQDKVKMELNFLRSQINPHFLFNALNNIYSMIYTGDQHAADSVLSLSEMLRYVTYESKESRILLSGEISYLENYIEFQKFSYEGEINVVFEKDILSDTILIAPMLFQPFVENAFKYSGIGQDKDAYIRISLSSDNNKLLFSIENSKKKMSYSDKELKNNGIGIENVKKRLDLMYPNRHSLVIDDKGASFRMNMSIELDNDIKNNVLYGK